MKFKQFLEKINEGLELKDSETLGFYNTLPYGKVEVARKSNGKYYYFSRPNGRWMPIATDKIGTPVKEGISEAIKKKTVKINSYGKEDIDITELNVWLSSDDRISIDCGEASIKNDTAREWGGDYYSWMEDDIELSISIHGKTTILRSIYDDEKDVDSWIHVAGLTGKMKKIPKYGKPRNVYVIPVNANTKDITITAKALKEV